MLRTHSKPLLKAAAARLGTRHRPLLALATLACASACALPLTTARAQKSGPAPTRAAGARAHSDALLATPIGTPIGTPVTVPAAIPFNVSTYRYDNSRSGVNYQETVLKPSSIRQTVVNGTPTKIPFGKLFTRQLDGPSYGQPLYYSNLTVTSPYTGASSTHNVVFVTTNNNTIYAFDADNNTGTNSGALWSANFNSVPNGIGPTNGDDITDIFGLPEADIQPLVGIVGTPVIDAATKVMYVVVRTTEGAGYAHRLHALDISTGLEKSYSPQLIGQQVDVFGDVSPVIVPGIGDDPYDVNNVFFDTATQLQRPALTITAKDVTAPNGVVTTTKTVHVAYGGFTNAPPYHGWLFAFDASTLNPQSVFCTTPNESNSFVVGDPITTGGIDMSGVGPAADTSGLYFSTGLGNADRNRASNGESVLKLRLYNEGTGPAFPYQTVPTPLPQPDILGIFTPYNFAFLTANQLDLGVGGVALLPPNLIAGHPHAMVTAGYQGTIYLLDVDNVYATNPIDNPTGDIPPTGAPFTGAIATFPNQIGPAFGVPAVYTSATGTTVYYHGAGDVLTPFTVSPNAPYLTPTGQNGSARFDFPGAMPVISSNGTDSTSAIIWELEPRTTTQPGGGGIFSQPRTAVLHAYDAATLTELFSSTANGGGATNIGDYVDFSQPLVANGKVYVAAGTPTQNGALTATTTGNLTVFGLLPAAATPTTKALHYLISGPLLGGNVLANRSNYYSITAVDADYKAVSINNTDVALTLTNQFTGRKLSMGSVHFSNQSSVIFSRAITSETFGLGFGSNNYILQGFDNSGNSSNVTQLGVTSSSGGGGFDRYNIRVASAVRDGATATVTVTAVNQSGFATPYASTVQIYDTLPSGVQDVTFGTGYAYETQGSFPYGSLFGQPTASAQTYNIVLNGVGQHILVVQDFNFSTFSFTATTALVNVIASNGSSVTSN